jgi:hypothetical protein
MRKFMQGLVKMFEHLINIHLVTLSLQGVLRSGLTAMWNYLRRKWPTLTFLPAPNARYTLHTYSLLFAVSSIQLLHVSNA